MNLNISKMVKGLLTAFLFAVITPAAAAGVVLGAAGAAHAVDEAVSTPVLVPLPPAEASEPAPAPNSDAVSEVPLAPKREATRLPTPLSPLAESYKAAPRVARTQAD